MELERKKAFLTRTCYYLFIAAVIFVALRYLWALLLPFLTGFAVAYALRPATNFMCRHSGISRRGASIACAVIFYVAIFALFWMAGAAMLLKLSDVFLSLPQIYAENIEPDITGLNDKVTSFTEIFYSPRASDAVYKIIKNAAWEACVSASSWGMSWITGMAKAIPMAVLTLVFTIMSSVLICADYNGVTSFVMRQIPQRLHKTVLETRDFLARSILKLAKTYLILMIITFAMLSAGLWALKMENFMVYAAVIAFLDLLPVLGSGVVLIPWGIALIVMGNSFTGVGLLLLWGIVSFVREFLEPRILGGQIGLHPVVTVTSMYFGLKASGVGGLILAPVLCLLIRRLHDLDLIKLYNK